MSRTGRTSVHHVCYGEVGGCLVTGNEDGIKHVAMRVLYALQHLGYTIHRQAAPGEVRRLTLPRWEGR